MAGNDDNNSNTTLSMVAEAAKAAAGMTAAKAVLDAIVAVTKKALRKANVPEELINNEIAESLIALAAPVLINVLANTFGEQLDKALGKGKAQVLSNGSKLALEAAMTSIGMNAVDAIVPFVKTMFGEVLSATDGIHGLPGGAEERRSSAREA